MNNESIESVTTTAGLAGFIVLFSLAVVCWLLFRGMNKRLRNIRLREERDADERARDRERREETVPDQTVPAERSGEAGEPGEVDHSG